MKIWLPILLLNTLCIACNSKKSLPVPSEQVNILVDRTDTFSIGPDVNSVLRLFKLNNHPDRAVRFNITELRDKVFNPESWYYLPDGATTEKTNVLEDPHFREKLIIACYDSVSRIINSFLIKTPADTALPHSVCFKSIARQLQIMKKKPAAENYLLVFSDVLENSEIFSAYTAKGKSLLLGNPDSVYRIFHNTKLLPDDLTGFTVYFIYNPPDRDKDNLFDSMTAKIYRRLLEERAAKVYVTITNKIAPDGE